MATVTISREEAQELAERCATLLREQFGARRVILFGSAAGDAPWHTLLLQRTRLPFGSRRPAAIDRPLEVQLSECLRFRHLFRHTYGYDLKWERVRELSQELSGVFRELENQLNAFLSTLATEATNREE